MNRDKGRLRKLLLIIGVAAVVGLAFSHWAGVDGPGPESGLLQLRGEEDWTERLRMDRDPVPQPGASDEDADDATIQVVRSVGPTVVKITTTEEQVINDLLMGRMVQEQEGIGSGVIFDKRGLILTNSHVVASAKEILVWLPRRQDPYAGKLVGQDPYTDLAVVQIEGKDLPAAELGDSDELEVGQTVIAIGNPYGFENSVTRGLISALGRGLMIDPNTNLQLEGVIQTDASINPGNSGGPLLNLRGEVIGINTAIIREAQGIGFAIPINLARSVATDLINHGKVVRLGVLGGTITPAFITAYERQTGEKLLVESGVYVTEVIPDTAAARARLQPGDIITVVAGKRVTSIDELVRQVKTSGFGAQIQLTVYRGGDRKASRISVTLR